MKFSTQALILAAFSVVSAASSKVASAAPATGSAAKSVARTPYQNGTTTVQTTVFTTIPCPSPTTFSYNSQTFTVTKPTTLIVEDCGCTEKPSPVPAAPKSEAPKPQDATTTVKPTVYTTIECSTPTTFSYNSKTYTVTKPTTLTVEDCGCSETPGPAPAAPKSEAPQGTPAAPKPEAPQGTSQAPQGTPAAPKPEAPQGTSQAPKATSQPGAAKPSNSAPNNAPAPSAKPSGSASSTEIVPANNAAKAGFGAAAALAAGAVYLL